MDLNDIKAKIDTVAAKISGDPSIKEQFKTEPVKAVEKVLGVDLPDDVIEKVITGVKAKLAAGNASEKLSGVADKIKGLF